MVYYSYLFFYLPRKLYLHNCVKELELLKYFVALLIHKISNVCITFYVESGQRIITFKCNLYRYETKVTSILRGKEETV